MNPITAFLTIAFIGTGVALGMFGHLIIGVAFVIAAISVAAALKMANTWQKFVILRAGKLRGVKGPGPFLIIPVIDNVVAVIDERIQTTAFSAEAALTKDTVPVNVDAIIFWFVHDAQKAALNITNYREAIDRVAQTSLREMIGSSMPCSAMTMAAEPALRVAIVKTCDCGMWPARLNVACYAPQRNSDTSQAIILPAKSETTHPRAAIIAVPTANAPAIFHRVTA
jgi:hypothetical protein